MTRTFIALELNGAVQRHLASVMELVALALPQVRMVDPAGIHLTLAFLGELSAKQLEQATQATQEAAQQCAPFSYKLARLGIFGTLRQPRVIWVGIDEPAGALTHVHRVLNEALQQRDFVLDTRPFAPHFTLARLKAPLTADEQQPLQTLLANKQPPLVSTQSYPIQQLVVMKSELASTGARYTSIHSARLRSWP